VASSNFRASAPFIVMLYAFARPIGARYRGISPLQPVCYQL